MKIYIESIDRKIWNIIVNGFILKNVVNNEYAEKP